jgi:hypothetical protein
MRLVRAQYDAESAEAKERPLYEIILEYVDITDPKFEKLRARIGVSVKLTITTCEYGSVSWRMGNDEERKRRLARAKEILTLVDGASISTRSPSIKLPMPAACQL